MTTGSTGTQALSAQVKPLYGGRKSKAKKKPKAAPKTSSRRR